MGVGVAARMPCPVPVGLCVSGAPETDRFSRKVKPLMYAVQCRPATVMSRGIRAPSRSHRTPVSSSASVPVTRRLSLSFRPTRDPIGTPGAGSSGLTTRSSRDCDERGKARRLAVTPAAAPSRGTRGGEWGKESASGERTGFPRGAPPGPRPRSAAPVPRLPQPYARTGPASLECDESEIVSRPVVTWQSSTFAPWHLVAVESMPSTVAFAAEALASSACPGASPLSQYPSMAWMVPGKRPRTAGGGPT